MPTQLCSTCGRHVPPGTSCKGCDVSDPKARIPRGAQEGEHQRDQVMHDTLDEVQLDELIARGSVPTLAQLFKRGKEQGLIKPTNTYAVPQP